MDFYKTFKPTLCLNMIVKNESNIITRLFDSVLKIIDCYCICDTGSTDDTVSIIQNYFKKNIIPGKVVYEPFKNFCHNRNFSLNSAIGMSDYILLMDADMILEIKDFNKNELLIADSHSILQGNDDFYYDNMRIVKNNGLYSYCGVTHEYINTPSNNIKYSISKNKLFIRDIGDGGSKSNKVERDIKLLTDGINEEPTNARYHFYLANSYHDCGKYTEAIEIYKKRIHLGGWNQEVWYSFYRLGNCYKNTGDISKAIITWMDGYDYLPERLEGIYQIIMHYRIISKHKLAFMFYELALKILQKNNHIDGYLFLHKDVYSYKLYYEYTIIASWLGIKNINDELIIILNNCRDSNIIRNTFSNMKFYKNVLKPIDVINMDDKINILLNNENTLFNSSSSCLIHNENKNGYFLNIRYVNYYITETGSYLNCDNHIVSINKFVELDKDLKYTKEKLFDLNFVDRRYIGIEDIKIFNDLNKNKIIFIGTGLHNNNNIGIVMGDYDICKDILISSELTTDFSHSRCEKNWIFVDYKNETHIIYKWHPLQICKLDDINNQISIIETKEMPRIFSHVRGSTCGFRYNSNEIWFVVHLVSYENPRHYYHMIVIFDSMMNLLRYSAPFKFDTEPIEYCLSIVVEDERVLMNYSTWDRTTRIGVYDKKYIDSITKYK
jgi:tetratricopeptide (TPR) repeat protein